MEIADSKLESVSSSTVPSIVNWSSDEAESEIDNARNEIHQYINPNERISMDEDDLWFWTQFDF